MIKDFFSDYLDPRWWGRREWAVAGTLLAVVVLVAGFLYWPSGAPSSSTGTIGGSTTSSIGTATTPSSQPFVNPTGNTDPSSSGVPAAVAPSGVPSTSTVALYMDGWSMANVVPSSLGLSRQPTGATSSISWRSATSDDIAELQRDAPNLLREVAAHMITSSPSLRCDSSGCRDSQGAIPSSWFVDPSKIPGLGAEYKAYKITSTIWISSVPSTESANFFVRYGSSSLSLISPPPAPSGPGAAGFEAAVKSSSGAGFGANRWLVGSAFGQLYLPQASWLDAAHPADSYWSIGSGGPAVGGLLAEASKGTVLSAGLGVPSADASQLTASQLGSWSSPSKGCVLGVLCVPGSQSGLAATASVLKNFSVCQGATKAAAVAVATTWRFSLRGPIRQATGQSYETLSGAQQLPMTLLYLANGQPATLDQVVGASGLQGAGSVAALVGQLGAGYAAC